MGRRTQLGAVIFLVFAGLGFGISVWRTSDIYTRKSSYNMEDEPKWTSQPIKIKKQSKSKWNWEYLSQKNDNGDYEPYGFYRVVQMCPSVKQDAMLKVNGKIVYTTDEGLTKIANSYDLLNSHKEKVSMIRSGEQYDEAVGGKNTGISFGMYDQNNEISSYVIGEDFMNGNFKVQKPNGENLVDVTKNKISSAVWEYTLTYIGNTADKNIITPFQLSLALGHLAFIEDPYNYDICNITYLPFFITSTVCLCGALILFMFLCKQFWSNDPSYNDDKNVGGKRY